MQDVSSFAEDISPNRIVNTDDRFMLQDSVFNNTILRSAPPITVIATNQSGSEGLATKVDPHTFDSCEYLDNVVEVVQDIARDLGVLIMSQETDDPITLAEFAGDTVLCGFDENKTHLKNSWFSVKKWISALVGQDVDLESSFDYFSLWVNFRERAFRELSKSREKYVLNRYKDELMLCLVCVGYAYLITKGKSFRDSMA